MGLFGTLFAGPRPAISTGNSYNPAALRGLVGSFGYFGDGSYAEASSDWLKQFGDDFANELYRQNVTKWDGRFDCNHFAAYYVALAQVRFYAANFQSRTAPQTLAVGELWYRPASAGGNAHAIVIAVTESGLLFIEPQTRQSVKLTPDEWASRFLVKF